MSNSDFNAPELPALGIVADLDTDDRLLLSDYGEFLPLKDGNNLISEGAEQNSLYFLISGILHVHSEKDGKRTLIGRIEPGETIGEVSIFDPGKASANVTAQGFCQIWRATREDLNSFLEAYPQAAGRLLIGIIAEMSRRIRRMNEKLSTAELEASIQHFFH
jgi:CRP/FNR family transcriptional regulator, cyclic AMP receptor protein